MSLLIRLALIAAAIAAVIAGYTWWRNGVLDEGVQKERAVWVAKALQDEELQASDRRQQRQFSDRAAGQHLAAVELVTNQLGEANAKIAKLSGRVCLDAGTVRVLNNVGAPASDKPGGTAAGGTESAADASATDQDVSTFIAICKASYAKVSDQINKILDIEDRRYPPLK